MGCKIGFISLPEYFSPSGKFRNIERLRKHLMEADGIILSTPVYFGDRSSLAHDLIQFMRSDPALLEAMRGRVFSGIAVEAKRNGGQETTLIYQMVDMMNIGMLAVGNDSNTTAQYGGTAHAGDIGSAYKDDYGLWTTMGVGRRMARVLHILDRSKCCKLKTKLNIGFWIMQDKDGYAKKQIEKLVEKYSDQINPYIIDIANEYIHRCIACDVCPMYIDDDKVYRCKVKSDKDFLKNYHENFINLDAIVPVVYCPKSTVGFLSSYQIYNERTRYLRRGDYVFSNLAIAPFIFEEVGSNSSLRFRVLTSMIRHHTVMTHPIVAYIHENKILNNEQIIHDWENYIVEARRLTIGRLASSLCDEPSAQYNPVGYVLSTRKDEEDKKMDKRRLFTQYRRDRIQKMAGERLERI